MTLSRSVALSVSPTWKASLLQVCPDPDAPPDAHSVAWCGADQHRCFVDNDGQLELACVAPSEVDECWCGDAGPLPWILGGLALLCLCGVPFEVFDFLASRGKLFDTYFETVISDSVAVTARERRSDGEHDRLQTTVSLGCLSNTSALCSRRH